MRIIGWTALLAAVLVWNVGCNGEGDDDTAMPDDDTADDDVADDDADDDTADDDTADDDSATGDDDDSATGDDDDSATDDDTVGDDDTVSDADVRLLEIHLDNVTYDPVGYQFFELYDNPIALADAPGVVSADLPGSLVDGCTAQATYLGFHHCYRPPGDFGGAALVDGRSGELVFAGEIHWMGTGQLLYPMPLGDPADLQLLTGAPVIAPTSYEYALWGYEDTAVGDAALDAVRNMELVNQWVAWCTYDALVMLHPYSEGAYNPMSADLIVLLVLC